MVVICHQSRQHVVCWWNVLWWKSICKLHRNEHILCCLFHLFDDFCALTYCFTVEKTILAWSGLLKEPNMKALWWLCKIDLSGLNFGGHLGFKGQKWVKASKQHQKWIPWPQNHENHIWHGIVGQTIKKIILRLSFWIFVSYRFSPHFCKRHRG